MTEIILSARMDDLIKQRRVINAIHFEKLLQSSNIPTLRLVGDHSKFAVRMMQRVHQALMNSQFQVIPDSFDPSSLCNPEAFTTYLQKWLDEYQRGATET